jgi:hypothetical protein
MTICSHDTIYTPSAASHRPPLAPPRPVLDGSIEEGISGVAEDAEAFRFRADAWTLGMSALPMLILLRP